MLSCPEKLKEIRCYELESPANEVFLSAISIVELMIKSSIGKLNIKFNPLEMAEKMLVDILDFSGTHAVALGKMPFHHKDPFDRMIIAQAITNKLVLMTDDSKFSKYNIKII
ncbi:MAG: PIN domain nuclease [Deltaproteobacteria bacterium]|nr:MAG: PIN domain nuclease [Deltaproteobacteria bacterium]